LIKKKSAPILFLGVGGEIGVLYSTMNSILSICEEYSDNTWYSDFRVNSIPSKIAIEIEKKYKFAFLKAMAKQGFALDGTRRVDEHKFILQLVKIEESALLSDQI
jgi:hypothetical protein